MTNFHTVECSYLKCKSKQFSRSSPITALLLLQTALRLECNLISRPFEHTLHSKRLGRDTKWPQTISIQILKWDGASRSGIPAPVEGSLRQEILLVILKTVRPQLSGKVDDILSVLLIGKTSTVQKDFYKSGGSHRVRSSVQ